MARRRRRRVAWLPPHAGEALEGAEGILTTGRTFQLFVLNTGLTNLAIDPVAEDTPADEENVAVAAPGKMNLILGQEYVLKRIVGNIHVQFVPQRQASDDPSSPFAAYVVAGFFVARAEHDQTDLPIGAVGTNARDNYSPFLANNMREPWIWRRSWILGNQAQKEANIAAARANLAINPSAVTGAAWNFPGSNAEYGDIRQGCHIDAKTGRRIGNDDRLFFAISVVQYPIGSTSNLTGLVEGVYDVRLLGALRRARNRSAF